jgi:DNA-binding transcriptional ArsR family regulator
MARSDHTLMTTVPVSLGWVRLHMDTPPADELPPAASTPLGLTDRDRRVLAALGDSVALAILASLSRGERDGHGLVVETDLPQSSIYRKLRELQDGSLVEVRRLAFTREGRKVEVFSSRLREVNVEFANGRTRVRLRTREDSSDRIRDLWAEVRR